MSIDISPFGGPQGAGAGQPRCTRARRSFHRRPPRPPRLCRPWPTSRRPGPGQTASAASSPGPR
eukprot:scaffold22373_cov35-Prasinocladus_malaysianus.AAC.2